MKKTLKLITEHNAKIEYLTEDNNQGKKNYYISGVFMQAETVNKNNRIYPLRIINDQVKKYNEVYVKNGRALGELGHPQDPQINLERVSHKITELRLDGTNVVGKAKILDTPYGKIAKNLIDEGVSLGVSSRALGSLKEREDGVSEVCDDFELATVDIVWDPSAPQAFVNGIMENREWIYENGIIKSVEVQKYKDKIKRIPKHQLESEIVNVFENFIRQLKRK
jgi:hypothetical protein